MTTSQLLEYLHDHPATDLLAEAIAQVLVLRGRPDLASTPFPIDARRKAS